jgi:hypothetical protein
MKKEALYRALTIVTPLITVLLAAGVSTYEWQRLKRLESETASTQAKLDHISRELRDFEAQPQTEKYPTVARTPREQALFLDTLRANADISKVQLVRWTNSMQPATADKASGLPAGVSAIVSIVEVAGRSENTRQFLYNVIRTRRLLNMSDLKWIRDTWPNTHLTFTLTRYVAPPVQLPSQQLHLDRAGAETHRSGGPRSAALSTTRSDAQSSSAQRSVGISLPNPMDAPGIAHGAYQSRLDAGVAQLNELDRTQSPASSRPPTAANTKR